MPLGLVSPRPLLRGQLAIAPSWLASLGTDPEADWAGSRVPPYGYLHLTNMWHCFPHMCWSKAGRLFWLRAHGFWDVRLDQLGITPRGPPFRAATTRALALPDGAYDAIRRLKPPTRAGQRANAIERGAAFRRAHALVHNLVLVAALINRRPAIPRWPCDFVAAVQPLVGHTSASRAGVCHPSVIVTGPADAPQCHLAPGTWRPGGPDQCYHSWSMSDFDYTRFLLRPRVGGSHNGSVRLERARNASALVHSLRALCRAAQRQAELPLMILDGAERQPELPARESGHLIDRPLANDEFVSETQRAKSGRPRWESLLQRKELLALRDDCPGAAKFIGFRKACVGYFLAE